METPETIAYRQTCRDVQARLLEGRALIIAAHRAPVSLGRDPSGALAWKRSAGGLVTALTGLARSMDATWIGTAASPEDSEWQSGRIPLDDDGRASIQVQFIDPGLEAFHQYYGVISNPLLWFLHHSMWDLALSPTIDRSTWDAWEQGYVYTNRLLGEAVARCIQVNPRPSLVMLQDYQLYLAPMFLRAALQRIAPRHAMALRQRGSGSGMFDEAAPDGGPRRLTLTHFIHIPWPGPEDWGFLPPAMRRSILESLCSVDLLGFQTREDALNFIRTCESHLPRASVNFKRGRVWFRNHATHVRDFPISIDVGALRQMAHAEETEAYYNQLKELAQNTRLILRIDRTDPSKNIVRGFMAFEELLAMHPELHGQVTFLAVLAPSRLGVEEYQSYLDSASAAAGRVNARFGTSHWEPVRLLLGESYPRAVAALRLYDVLLINSIADGMNLVAKEGPIVNERDGVLILSERTGARQQLEPGALMISPCDIYATAQAMHQALVMSAAERRERAIRLRYVIEREDIQDWLCRQLEALEQLNL